MKKKCRLAQNLGFLKWSVIRRIKVHINLIAREQVTILLSKNKKILNNLLKEKIRKFNRLFLNKISFQKLLLINICLIR